MTYPLVPAPPRPPDLAPRPMEYPQVLRGPRHRWWRPLLSLVILVAGTLLVMILGMVASMVAVALSGGDVEKWARSAADAAMTPGLFLATNLMLAALIPVSMLAVWIGHGVSSRWLRSVVGRFRWGWFARCLAVLTPLWLVYTGLGIAVDGAPEGGRPKEWLALLVIMLLTTPVQCAGEEFLFRGWVLTSLGSWFRHRWIALAVPMVVSCAGFSAAHGSKDVWVVADLSVFAITACLLTWRTGGLEAAIALHCVNNMLVMGISIALGGFDQGFIDGETTSSPLPVVTSIVVMSVAYALVEWQARRAGIQRRSTPQIPPPPMVPASPASPDSPASPTSPVAPGPV
ncbi:CPBP family intramembrane glutamic endopeptidase [Arsenicicoccus sp. oral taxon 190]|uniref:CPBP family intramembrane glutamic endopeptidase n=1 Tax=Arsenicicoccus sp. oral taxon 190 TaxID=1658671 RepID=UPI00067C1608|nr:type II CAAX endopeptidase family protein [Arsenicicoccus sp. oral taxon 190]